MIRQGLAVLLGLLLCSATLLAQDDTKTQAARVRRYERMGSGGDAIMEATVDLVHYTSQPIDAVVRVCSNEPMPLALSIAAMNPFIVARALNQGYNFSLERILFLRSEDCLGSDPAVAATELWAVPKGAALPPFVESIKSSHTHLEILGTKDLLAAGTRNYRLAVRELTTKLRTAPEAMGVVVGYYYKNPSLMMRRRLREVRKMLEQSGLRQDRYFVRFIPWPGERSIDPPEAEPKYPSVFVVKVERDTARR